MTGYEMLVIFIIICAFFGNYQEQAQVKSGTDRIYYRQPCTQSNYLMIGLSNSRTDKQYPEQNPKLQIDIPSPYSNQNILSRPPISPSNQNILSRSINKRDADADYMARFVEELPEERLHRSKSRSMKLKQSNRGDNSLVETKLRVKQNVVTVKEEPPVLNSNHNGVTVPGFETEEFQQKKFKKFSINAMIKEREMVKQSNYFDESRFGDADINPVEDRARADFRIGQSGQFQTFQVKTYLYDRNLNQKLTN